MTGYYWIASPPPFGISGIAHSWFSSYLYVRSRSVSANGIFSNPRPLSFGVPQGSVLGPILYILYNCPLHEIVSKTGVSEHYFADDAHIFKSFTPSPSAAEQHLAYSHLTASIDEQKKWLTANKLKLNPDKTIALLVSSSTTTKKPSSSLPLIADGLPITPSTSVRNLGVLLDSHLSLDLQINSSCKKAYFHLRRIARIKKFLTTPLS